MRGFQCLVRMPPGRLPVEVVLGTSHQEEAPGKSQNTLENLCLPVGLRVLWLPLRRADKAIMETEVCGSLLRPPPQPNSDMQPRMDG